MNVIPLEKPFFLDVMDLGQIGAGTVVDFIPRDRRRWTSIPRNARTFDQFSEYEVCGDSLEGRNIFDGYILLCRRNFEISEVTPDRIVILNIISTGELTAKSIKQNGDGTVTVLAWNPKYEPRTFFEDEVEIIALAVEFKGKI